MLEDQHNSNQTQSSTEERAVGPTLSSRLRNNRFASHFLSLMGICIVVLLTSWIWIQVRERFPKLPDGVYAGKIVLPADSEGETGRSIDWYIESTKSGTFFIAPISQGMKPSVFDYVLRGDSEGDKWVHPVVIPIGKSEYSFTGAPLREEGYTGILKDVQTGLEGSWELSSTRIAPHNSKILDEKALEHWLSLKSELIKVQKEIKASETNLEAQKDEIEKLSEFITDTDKLKERAESRFSKVKTEWSTAKNSLEELRRKIKQLERQVALAQRVTHHGTLVSLARESLERESRWVESMFRSQAGNSGADFLQGVSYGERVLSLREQITQERENIANLRLIKERRSGIPQESESFENLWGEQ